jgi:exodeoxyribonuclease V beta subunit
LERSPVSELPLAYRMPLSGTTLIEASAGTGKTYTLVRLMARHLLWHGHGIEQVLAVTFTNAAAAELKQRLRGFLQQVAWWLEQQTEGDDIRHLFEQRPADVSAAEFRARLQLALASIDRAAVYTIHGFCQALLQRHALAFKQRIPAPALLENERALALRVCEEFWRAQSLDAQNAALLNREFKTPEQMAGNLTELLSENELMPLLQEGVAPDGQAALAALQESYNAHHESALQEMLAAYADKALQGGTFKTENHVREPFAQLASFLGAPQLNDPPIFSRIAFSQIKEKKNKTKPDNPLLHALDDWNAFVDALNAYQQQRVFALHHALKAFAGLRLAALKQEQSVIGFDDIIGAVHAVLETKPTALCAEIRRSWPVALVDEFQDTDQRQWRIFEHLYHQSETHSLILIGDPKQAIYGFRGGDIHTYMSVQALAGHRESLRDNFRSNQALLDGIQAVFTQKQARPFMHEAIEFSMVRAGRQGPQLLCDEQVQPALQLLELHTAADGKALSVEVARQQAADACADAIAAWLRRARAGLARVHEAGGERALQVHDIVVLVNRNQDARLMQRALQSRRVDSVCVQRTAVFASYAALDVLALLQYIQTPNARRAEQTACNGLLWRAALYGQAVLDPIALLIRLRQLGPLAALSPLLMAAQAALAREPDGERHLADYAQLLELLQAQFKANDEIGHCRDWLAQRIEQATNTNPLATELPYLASSHARIRIMTIHQSKGLEFGYVFMPFTAIRQPLKKGLARYVSDGKRCLHIKHSLADDQTKALIECEHRSESLRLLYVGFTRARFGLCFSAGAVKDFDDSALGLLLSREVQAALPRLMHSTQSGQLGTPPAPMPFPAIAIPAARQTNWQINSFSGWHKAVEADYVHAADDEMQSPAITADANPFKGAAFGNAMHAVLENALAEHWQQQSIPALAQCTQALLQFGYTASLAEAGAAPLAALVRACLHAALPESCTLLALADRDKRHEMEFHLRLKHADSAQVLALMQHYGYCLKRSRLGFGERLNGLLTGKIDLLYRVVGRIYILDYKSNTLPDYSPESMQSSIRDNEYDLQYLLYSVAVHRWLRQQRRDYQYAQHFGGVRYMYARGIDLSKAQSGLFCDWPDAGLIHALDACFDGGP